MLQENVEVISIFKNGKVIGCDLEGALGGVVVLWNDFRIQGEVLLAKNNIICIKFSHIRDNFSWILSNIYAPYSKNGRLDFWDGLGSFRSSISNFLWLVMGDFNTPQNDSDKVGDISSQAHLDGRLDFMDFITLNALLDMDLHGCSYTW